MNRIIAESSTLGMTKEPSRGVFWIVDGKVRSFPFHNNAYSPGVSNSDLNHYQLQQNTLLIIPAKIELQLSGAPTGN